MLKSNVLVKCSVCLNKDLNVPVTKNRLGVSPLNLFRLNEEMTLSVSSLVWTHDDDEEVDDVEV